MSEAHEMLYQAPPPINDDLLRAIEQANADIRSCFAIDLPPPRTLSTWEEAQIIARYRSSSPTPSHSIEGER